jgi:argininosuccinate lyase
LLKEHLIPAFNDLQNCLKMAGLMISNISIKKNILEDEKYKFIFSVEEVNKLVSKGISFRDAYKQIGADIEKGKFKYETKVAHTHEGSIGNLQNEQIQKMMADIIQQFNFKKVNTALEKLIR